jgi:protein AroM
VTALAPLDDADTLFTRLPDGSGVKISKRGVVREGTRQLEQLADGGYDVTMVLCTGEFPEWAGRFRVVFPSRVLHAAVTGLQPQGRLGVFTPLPEQVAKSTARWRADGYDAAVVALSPNADGPAAAEAARALAATPPDLLVFDCISYTSVIKHAACRTLDRSRGAGDQLLRAARGGAGELAQTIREAAKRGRGDAGRFGPHGPRSEEA